MRHAALVARNGGARADGRGDRAGGLRAGSASQTSKRAARTTTSKTAMLRLIARSSGVWKEHCPRIVAKAPQL